MISHSSMHTPRLLDAVRRVDNAARTIMERLATGLRINDMGDDPGGLVEVDLLNADTRSLAQTLVNINQGISLGTVAQDGLDRIAVLLAQMEDLATDAAKVYMGAPERLVLNSQYLDLRGQIETIAVNTEYENIKLLDGSMGGGIPAEAAVVTAPVAQVTTLALGETFTFEDWGIFSGMSAAARTITFPGFVAGTPDEPAVVTAPVAQTLPIDRDERLEFEDWGIFSGMTDGQRRITLVSGQTQIQVMNAINADADIGPLAQASINGSGQLVLTSVATGSSAQFRVFSNRDPDPDQTGIGRTHLQGDGVDGTPDDPGYSQTEVVDAINADADISPLVQASVNGAGQLVLTSVASGSSAEFRVSSDLAAAGDSTGLGTDLLEDSGVDAQEGTGGLEIQAHIHNEPPNSRIGVEISPVTLEALGLTGSSIDTATNAQAAITEVDGAQEDIVRVTGEVDAIVARLAFAANNALSGQAETHKAILRIQDVDQAQEVLALAVVQIIQNSSKAMVAQARITPQMAMSLL